jgi:hypothetical protein
LDVMSTTQCRKVLKAAGDKPFSNNSSDDGMGRK